MRVGLPKIPIGLAQARSLLLCRERFEEGAREGLVYFLPKTNEGEIVVGICLREDDMRFLRDDEEVGRYAVYIG